MRVSAFPVFFSLALTLASGVTLAQTSGKGASGGKTVPETKPPIFSSLFANPTFKNGYEEWVQAADLIQNNAEVDAATLPGATLTFKRHVLGDPLVEKALLLLRKGLKKPVGSPREDFDENTLLPELAAFRKLARLLRTEQYVAFADGRADAAIESLRVGLAFGYLIQTDCLISGLVGLAVDTIVLDEFARHFDQLSANQCDQVARLVREWLKAENPALRVLALERGQSLKALEARRSDANALLTLLKSVGTGDDPDEAASLQRLKNYLAGDPQDLNVILNDAKNRVNALYDQALLNLGLPLAQRKPFARDRIDAPGAILCRMIAPDLQRVLDRYSSDQAKLRLLGVHVLIRRYRWEHDALPNALSDLRANDLTEDPFTGSQMVYQRDGDRYTLHSQGPFKRDGAGQEASQERVPVKLTSERP